MKWVLAAWIAAHAADAASTELVLRGGRAEEIILPGNAGARLAVKGGQAAGGAWLVRRLYRRNKRAAWVLVASVDAAYVWVVAHNVAAGR